MSLPTPDQVSPGAPPAKPGARDVSHTLHGPELSWLHLIVDGVLAPVFGSAQPSSAGDVGITAPPLRMPGHQLSAGDGVALLDPEGVTVAQLTVRSVDDDLVSGEVESRSGFTIVDHVDHRARRNHARR